MATNAPLILSAAVCKLHEHEHDHNNHSSHHHKPAGHGPDSEAHHGASGSTSSRLHLVAEHRLNDGPTAGQLPAIGDALQLIEQGADLQKSHADRIVLDHHVLYYSVYATPQGNTVYLCLADAPSTNENDAADATAHAAAAAQFLGLLQYAVNSDAELTHAISLPNLGAVKTHDQDPEQDRIRPRFCDLVTNAHRSAMDYAYNQRKQQMNVAPPSSSSTATANGGASQFGPQSSARIVELQRQVQDVKTVMSDNVVRIMERGERLENLDTRTEALHASSQNFKTTARRVQRNMCLKNLKWTIILSVFCALLVTFLVYATLRELGVIGGGGN